MLNTAHLPRREPLGGVAAAEPSRDRSTATTRTARRSSTAPPPWTRTRACVGPGAHRAGLPRHGRRATVVGPVVLGVGCAVEPRRVVSRTVAWNRCTVGAQAVVDASVLADDAACDARARALSRRGAACRRAPELRRRRAALRIASPGAWPRPRARCGRAGLARSTVNVYPHPARLATALRGRRPGRRLRRPLRCCCCRSARARCCATSRRACAPSPRIRPTSFADLRTERPRTATRSARLDPGDRRRGGPDEFRARLDALRAVRLAAGGGPDAASPRHGLAPESLVRHPMADPRWVRHLVALESNADGTRECVDVRRAGRVRRIQRFYDERDLALHGGRVLLAAARARARCWREDLPWTSLAEMRHGPAAPRHPQPRPAHRRGAVVEPGASRRTCWRSASGSSRRPRRAACRASRTRRAVRRRRPARARAPRGWWGRWCCRRARSWRRAPPCSGPR